MTFKKYLTLAGVVVGAVVLTGVGSFLPGKKATLGVAVAEAAEDAHAEEAKVAAIPEGAPSTAYVPWKGLFAALAIVGTAFCTALAQMKIGGAGAGAIAERPETAGIFIALVAIPETIVILGFVIAAMLIMF